MKLLGIVDDISDVSPVRFIRRFAVVVGSSPRR